MGLLGEKPGWRGYMNQKMELLFGTMGTCLPGGILWSLWQLPMDLAGRPDGEGALSDSLMMCGGRMLLLTCFGTFLMWFTKKTDNVFSAVVAHSMFNQSQGALGRLLSQAISPKTHNGNNALSVPESVIYSIIRGLFRLIYSEQCF